MDAGAATGQILDRFDDKCAFGFRCLGLNEVCTGVYGSDLEITSARGEFLAGL